MALNAKTGGRWLETVGLLVIAGAVMTGAILLSGAGGNPPFRFQKRSIEYYHLMVDGFRAGQLSLREMPPPGLAAVADPYDPQQRQAAGADGMTDVSYFNNRYYLYFGVGPALTLFWPFRALTGLHFSQNLAVGLYCAGGYLASLCFWLALRRRYFPATGMVWTWLAALLLGTGSFCWMVLVNSRVWELPVAAGYFHSCLGLWLLFLAVESGKSRVWLVLAGVSFGLAVASRPQFVFVAMVVGIFMLWHARNLVRREGQSWSRALRSPLALLLPVSAIVGGLLIYNYLRFGDPFEFGVKYQLLAWNQSNTDLFSLTNYPANAYYYFTAAARWTRYFPFVGPVPAFSGPISTGVDDPYGILPNMPWAWFALAAPIMWWLWYRPVRGFGRWLLLPGAAFGAVCAADLGFIVSASRYQVDFLPLLSLLAAGGLLMLAERCRQWRHAGGLAVLAATLIVGASIFFHAMAAFEYGGQFQFTHPKLYDQLARALNRPVAWGESLRGDKHGPVQMKLRFSSDHLGTYEPLIVAGTVQQMDYLYVFYTDAAHVQIGFSHLGGAGIMTQPIPINYRQDHTLEVQMGSLYPPVTHPFFAQAGTNEIKSAKQMLKISFDSVPYIDQPAVFCDATPGQIIFGQNLITGFAGRRFSGQILELRRQPLSAPIVPFDGGAFVNLTFKLPAGRAGRREPLIATGEPAAGDVIFIVYDDDSHIRLGFHHRGSEPLLSDPLTVIPGEMQRLEVSLGSFYPRAKIRDERELAKALFAKFNDRLVWTEEAAFHPPRADRPLIGINAGQSDACEAAFTGTIVAVQPAPPISLLGTQTPFVFERYWLPAAEPRHGALRLHVQLPRDRAGGFEPLLVTGPSVSQADYVWIQYVDDHRIILGYEHTGGGGPRSGVIPIDLAQPHVIELDLPSLHAPEDSPYFAGRSLLAIAAAKSYVHVVVDGVRQIEGRVKGFESTPAHVTPGENRVSQAFGQKFTGRILAIEQGSFAPPPGFVDELGPLEIALQWPASPAPGSVEALLATGGPTVGEVLQLVYEPGGFARLVVSDGKDNRLTSEPFKIAPGGSHLVRVAWGGFYLPALRPAGMAEEEWQRRARTVMVSLDDAQILSGTMTFTSEDPQHVRIGTAVAPGGDFSGVITAVRRLRP